MMRNISIERLRELVTYDPDTGIFAWKEYRGGRALAGAKITAKDRKGYIRARLDGELYFLHRVAWFYVHGYWPRRQIDHINLEKSDNRIENLREATNSQNKCNSRVRKDSSSGIKGVYQDRRTGRWRASITLNKKRLWLGFFSTPEEARKARLAAEVLHGNFSYKGPE